MTRAYQIPGAGQPVPRPAPHPPRVVYPAPYLPAGFPVDDVVDNCLVITECFGPRGHVSLNVSES